MASAPVENLSPKMFCGECGGAFAVQDLARFGNSYVCANCKPGYVQRMREGAQPIGASMAGVRYGGFWIRFLAVFIDTVIYMAVLVPIFMIFGLGAGFLRVAPGETPNVAFFGLIELLAVGLVLVYQVWFVTKKGATPGKMAVGLRIVTADGQNLTVGRAVARYFAYILSGMIIYIGYLIAAFDSEKRALHDHICNTRVIYK